MYILLCLILLVIIALYDMLAVRAIDIIEDVRSYLLLMSITPSYLENCFFIYFFFLCDVLVYNIVVILVLFCWLRLELLSNKLCSSALLSVARAISRYKSLNM